MHGSGLTPSSSSLKYGNGRTVQPKVNGQTEVEIHGWAADPSGKARQDKRVVPGASLQQAAHVHPLHKKGQVKQQAEFAVHEDLRLRIVKA